MSLLKQEPGGGLLGKWVGRTKCLQISLCVCHKACLSLANRVKEAQPSGSPFNCDTQLRPLIALRSPTGMWPGDTPGSWVPSLYFYNPAPGHPQKYSFDLCNGQKAVFRSIPLFSKCSSLRQLLWCFYSSSSCWLKQRWRPRMRRSVQTWSRYESRHDAALKEASHDPESMFPKPAAFMSNLCTDKPMRRRVHRKRQKWLMQET